METAIVKKDEHLTVRKNQAELLRDFIQQQGLSKNFGGQKDHIFYEGWAFLGELAGYHTSTRIIEELYDANRVWFGVRATVDLLDKDDKVVATVTASCTRDEPNWRMKPRFQLESMAQTRGASKAFRMRLAPIVALAGYNPTPAEEMLPEEGKWTAHDAPVQTDKRPRGRPRKDQAAPAPDSPEAVEAAFSSMLERDKLPKGLALAYLETLSVEENKDLLELKTRAITRPGPFAKALSAYIDLQNQAPEIVDRDTAGDPVQPPAQEVTNG